jgi:hypothetical protein
MKCGLPTIQNLDGEVPQILGDETEILYFFEGILVYDSSCAIVPFLLSFLQPYFSALEGVAKAALNCAHRTSTF